jgi:hypothetical protein
MNDKQNESTVKKFLIVMLICIVCGSIIGFIFIPFIKEYMETKRAKIQKELLFQSLSSQLTSMVSDLSGYMDYPNKFLIQNGKGFKIGPDEYGIIINGNIDCSIKYSSILPPQEIRFCTEFPAKDKERVSVTLQLKDKIIREFWIVDYKDNKFNLYRQNGFKIQIIK